MRLAPVLDSIESASLWKALHAVRHAPLTIDASAVERLGAQCLQLLLAAQGTWRADGVAFAVVNPSSAFNDAVNLADAGQLTAPEGNL